MSEPRQGSTVIPSFRYADGQAAIEWLGRAFGFQEHVVYRGESGEVEHAQLTHATGMIMLGTTRDDEWGAVVRDARGSTYVVVDEVDAHCEQAKAAGAEIVYGPRDTEYGSREYAARDPEGNVWSFGTYDPWAQAE